MAGRIRQVDGIGKTVQQGHIVMFGAVGLCLGKLIGTGIKSKDMAIITNILCQMSQQMTAATTDIKHMVTIADGKRLEDGLTAGHARHAGGGAPL